MINKIKKISIIVIVLILTHFTAYSYGKKITNLENKHHQELVKDKVIILGLNSNKILDENTKEIIDKYYVDVSNIYEYKETLKNEIQKINNDDGLIIDAEWLRIYNQSITDINGIIRSSN